jgi:diguanylate cyclase (GGDEF)-like protein/PAS domain S-box-containing protein
MGLSRFESESRLYYVSLFALFGMAIALCTALLSYRMELHSLDTKLSQNAEAVFDLKIEEFDNFNAGLEEIVGSVRDSSFLYNYLKDPSPANYDSLAACILTVANAHLSVMQLRYLDENGLERVRVDWMVGDKRAHQIGQDLLQDKSKRYYFLESSQVPPFHYWYSNLDLNVEQGKIESPEKPVLRIASPVYINQQFRGVVIVNVRMKEFLNRFLSNGVFHLSLIDKDGYFLASHDEEKSWSRYRETGYQVGNVYPEQANQILHYAMDGGLKKIGKIFTGSFSKLLNKDGAVLLMVADEVTVHIMEEERQKAAVLIVAIIVLLSIPLALLISRGPVRLHKKISSQNRKLTESIELIDKNINRASLDLQRNFQEVSSALATSLGGSKASFVGIQYSQLYCDLQPREYYDKVWEALERDGSWSGELQHAKGDGECFWADTVVLPRVDEEGILVGYSLIYQDITDKKRIEELSVRDELTGLYNRRFFNAVISKELSQVQRDKNVIVFAMMDLDFFKQYNDNYGHQQGDVVLKQVSAAISSKLTRGSDYCFRLGGEEFGLLFTKKDNERTFDFVDSIRRTVEEEAIEHKWSSVSSVVTVSIGMVVIGPLPGATVDQVYKGADEALYAAKNEGRNCVVLRRFGSDKNETEG